ncbi:MAG: ABC transporter substrate-binding protein [Hyphomicrobiales bacterium]|nr:MAG: ABC transporter substrate-binding protein [Hyphomicrobiales bacterium]
MNLYKRILVSTVALTLATSLSVQANAENLKVVASFTIVADFAKNVGGEKIDIITLVGPNGDAHVYNPKPSDAVALSKANVILTNGLNFEGFLSKLVEASGTKAQIIKLTKGVEVLEAKEGHDQDHEENHSDVDQGDEHKDAEGHDHGENDPHAWQSVANAKMYVNNIAKAFCIADVSGCNVYEINASTYLKKLDKLEQFIKTSVSEIPQNKRTVITSHDAFGYFEHEYGIKFLAPEGISTETEASAADIAALIVQVKEDKASAIFVENISNARLIEQISKETGIEIGGSLYSDSLSDKNGPASSYIQMMRHNINTIKGAIIATKK